MSVGKIFHVIWVEVSLSSHRWLEYPSPLSFGSHLCLAENKTNSRRKGRLKTHRELNICLKAEKQKANKSQRTYKDVSKYKS